MIHLIWSKAHLFAVGIQKLARRATLTFFLGQEKMSLNEQKFGLFLYKLRLSKKSLCLIIKKIDINLCIISVSESKT